MKGIIIAGGAGTRLRPLTYTRPKPLIPVVNRPFLEYQVALLRRHGIDEIIFCTNYMADQIEAHFGNGSAFGVSMKYAIEDTPLGTAGAIKNAQSIAGSDAFIVLNGDVLTDFDLSEIIAFHKAKEALVTLTLQQVPSPSPYGVIVTDGDGRVREFKEPSEEVKKKLAANPNIEPTGTDYINAGIYVMQAEALERIPTGRPVSIERETYPQMLASNEPLYATVAEGFWLDIGRPAQYRQATQAILQRDIVVEVPGECVDGYWAEAGTDVDPTAHIAPTVHIGKNAKVEGGASLAGRTVLGPNCVIGENASLTDCILEANVRVDAGAKLQGVILDDNCHVGEGVVITHNIVFAAGSHLGKGTRINGVE
jgi:mannose-1-phosphate guanylyltransferase/phosphomannomutase